MNENIDLTKILEGCPIGTEFYHLAYGKVWLTGIDLDDNEYPIRLSLHNDNYTNVTVTKEGLHCIHYPGECVFFPSKDQRDWSKFVRFWDNPKVEVEKFDPNTLQPFDKVLIRDGNFWTIDFFSYIGGQRLLGIWSAGVLDCCKGKFKSSKGYIWKYAPEVTFENSPVEVELVIKK